MLGVLVNGAAVFIGGIIGLLFKKGISKSIEGSINKAMGIVVVIIGLNGVISTMFSVNADGALKSNGELLLVVSFAIGTLVGEVLKLDDRFNNFSEGLEHKFKIDGFTSGFVTASSLFCIGAMAIIGSINSGLSGDHSTLFTKSIIDGVTAVILAASLGVGVMLSAIPVMLYQGSIALLAGVLSNVLVGELLVQVTMVGYTLIICVGLNLMTTLKFKAINMLPALFVPVVFQWILQLQVSIGRE
ncbi:MAG: ydfK [Anaerocolumna sp.]|nr:ydfK [Anaerocolumna sp.]